MASGLNTSDYYKSHPKARAKKNAYQKKFNSSALQIRKRTALNAENRRRGTYGNGDKLDVSHKKGGGTKLEAQSKNRARNRGKA
jgi:hypothetical protein|tara:strand:+ start:73 stop:324 length:252 start_codon:yes stop_codon:yes gene_type:complete